MLDRRRIFSGRRPIDGTMLELEDKDFKITGKSMLKKVAKKVDNMCDGEF